MDLRQLEYVVAVADTLSFTRAAKRCNVVQSALSHQIARLEEELDTRLFERSSRSVSITQSGELLVEYAKRILMTAGEARAELDALGGLKRGRLALGATQTAGRALEVVELFGFYHRQFPGVELSVHTGPASELIGDVRAGSLDIALVAETYTGDDLEWVTLIENEPLVAVVGREHPLADRKRVRLVDLAASGDLIEFRNDTGLRETIDAAFAQAGVPRQASLQLGRVSDMVRFASHGFGAAIVPRVFALQAPAGAGPYATLRLTEPLGLSIGAVYRSGRPAPTLRVFLGMLEAHHKLLARKTGRRT
jgi:DNA-binding transcriptional LysR family regulator